MKQFGKLKFLKSLPFLQETPKEILIKHYPVMYKEVLKKVQRYCKLEESKYNLLDCTYGTGGHSKILLDHVPNLEILGLDLDERMVQKYGIEQNPRLKVKCDNFINFQSHQTQKSFDIIFADLGYNIIQVHDDSYGLSYRANQNVLDMRYSKNLSRSAVDILNKASQQEIREILHNYGDIYKSNQLSRAIVQKRQLTTFNTSEDVINLLNELEMGGCIAQTFQALRIAVNGEITNLKLFLSQLSKQELSENQLVLIITFHSLEAEQIQKFIQQHSYELKSVQTTKPTEIEIEENPRSRSAKLFEFIIKMKK